MKDGERNRQGSPGVADAEPVRVGVARRHGSSFGSSHRTALEGLRLVEEDGNAQHQMRADCA